MTAAPSGLRGVVVGESSICDVHADGDLFYRGYNIHDLAENATFEETVFLLWNGKLPTRGELAGFRTALSMEAQLPERLTDLLPALHKECSAMDALRTMVSALGTYDPDAGKNSETANRRKALRLQAKMPTIVAAIERWMQGKPPIAPRAELGLAANFLLMLSGTEPDPLFVRAMDVDFTLHADHELNASTFAARVTVATHADLYSGAVSGIGALSGPRHGGAAEETMRMLLEIGEVANVEGWVTEKLSGEKRTAVPGFGHAVYRAPDPRARHLRQLSAELADRLGDRRWHDMTEAAEKVVDRLSNTPERMAAGKQPIYANVDCFSASCYHQLGLPMRLFTPIFAISRMAGWCAHMMEQYQPDQKIIRPRAEYVGDLNLEWTPIEDR